MLRSVLANPDIAEASDARRMAFDAGYDDVAARNVGDAAADIAEVVGAVEGESPELVAVAVVSARPHVRARGGRRFGSCDDDGPVAGHRNSASLIRAVGGVVVRLGPDLVAVRVVLAHPQV